MSWESTALTAHPRSRGEHDVNLSHKEITGGSSPLARGTWPPTLRSCRYIRLIPARAGNMGATPITSKNDPAHPRSRGEHKPSLTTVCRTHGSSPLARGTFITVDNTGGLVRLIPARAGNIEPSESGRWKVSAHPRSRGEHSRISDLSASGAGSSPLARGTSLTLQALTSIRRLIPARAGNIQIMSGIKSSRSAHPRSRGEHQQQLAGAITRAGSSPLARGTLGLPAL